ncbi:MAG: alpha/beta fold hydrolase [Blautia sp.]|nr:alpha/beta fold hydrolase [Blautia sp.]
MRNFLLQKDNGHQVACVQEVPEGAKGIVVAVHGFTSSKESPTVQRLLQRLPGCGLGVIGIDQPAHGTGASREEELRIEACKDSLEAAEQYACSQYPGAEIYYFGSSFGAYIIALYVSTRPHTGRKAFFRSAAVNMPELFRINRENPTETEKAYIRELDEKGYIQPSLDLGSPVKVTRAMLEDLAATDLFTVFNPGKYGAHQIAMAHGTADKVIDPKAAERFARQFRIPLTFFEGEGHSLSDRPGTADQVVDLALDLFLGR